MTINIGKNVKFKGKYHFRTRDEGKIIIEDNCYFDDDVRIVAAHGLIHIKKGVKIAKGTIINGGGNVVIGENTIIAPYCQINANEHILGGKNILENGFEYFEIIIGKNCFIGGGVVISKPVTIGDNSVIGSNSVVTKDIDSYSVNVGVPTKQIKRLKK